MSKEGAAVRDVGASRRIAYDVDLMRPGCVLLQAVMVGGGEWNIASAFPSETWLTHPTPGMKVYAVTDDELRRLVEMTVAASKARTPPHEQPAVQSPEEAPK